MSRPTEIASYTSDMPRDRLATHQRPKQGARLVALRKAAGLSQTQLAKAVGVPQQTVAYWETCATPPRSDVLPKMAKALGVRVEEILSDTPINAVRRPGPVGRLQRVFEKASALPRRDQQLVAEFVETLLERHRRAS
jgi:transcriptional regulator with XRE-family HTH domain